MTGHYVLLQVCGVFFSAGMIVIIKKPYQSSNKLELKKVRTELFKAAGDKLLMNKFIRQNFGGGRTLKSFRS